MLHIYIYIYTYKVYNLYICMCNAYMDGIDVDILCIHTLQVPYDTICGTCGVALFRMISYVTVVQGVRPLPLLKSILFRVEGLGFRVVSSERKSAHTNV